MLPQDFRDLRMSPPLGLGERRSLMNRMIVARRNSSPPLASLLKQPLDALVPAVSGHFGEAAIAVSIPLRVCARFAEKPHSFRMSRAYREVNRLGIKVPRQAQARIVPKQALKRGRVSGRSRCDRVPDVTSLGRFKLARLNHFYDRISHSTLQTLISPGLGYIGAGGIR